MILASERLTARDIASRGTRSVGSEVGFAIIGIREARKPTAIRHVRDALRRRRRQRAEARFSLKIAIPLPASPIRRIGTRFSVRARGSPLHRNRLSHRFHEETAPTEVLGGYL
jgi:hypothetical protein